MKICIDAGHYGKCNRSPMVKEYYESEMNWELHLLLKKHLESYGAQVITTRADRETDLRLLERGKKAKGCDLFLSVHSNACDDEGVDRPVVIVPLDGSSDALGQKLTDCIAAVMGTKQPGQLYKRSSKGREWYGVIRGAAEVGVPGVILEHSFHTNAAAARWLLDARNLDKLAEAEAAVIAAHYGLEKPVYRVQIGAFTVKANAEAALQKAKAVGFADAFIKEETA